MFVILLAELLFARSSSAGLAQSCIWKDGSVADGYLPCTNSSALSGNCCHQADTCLDTGLCYGSVGLIYRGACINEWGGDCITYCDDTNSEWANLYPCAYPNSGASLGPANWWCGPTNGQFCSSTNGTLIRMNPGMPVIINLGVNSSASSSSPLSSSTSATASSIESGGSISTGTTSTKVASMPTSSAATASNTEKAVNGTSSDSVSQTTVVGLGIGFGILCVIIVAAGLWIILSMRRRKSEHIASSTSSFPAQDPSMWKEEIDGRALNPQTEVEGHHVGSEMDAYGLTGRRPPVELGIGHN